MHCQVGLPPTYLPPPTCRSKTNHTTLTRSEKPDLLLLVLSLPEGHGLECILTHGKHLLELFIRQIPLLTSRIDAI